MNPFSRNSSIASQQFKATQLWDEIVFAFSKGVLVKRHRRRLRSYDACFVAKKAVDWLQSYLTFSPHFANQAVTRCQVVSLLKKFLKHDIICRVDGNEKAQFEDNKDLYRFTHSSPGVEDEVLPPVPQFQITSLSSSHQREHQYGSLTERQGQGLSENNDNISIPNNRPFFSYVQAMSIEYENAHKKRQYFEPQVKTDFSSIKRKQKENEDTVSLISARFFNPSPPMTSTNGGNIQAAANTLASVPAHSYISKIRSHKDGKASFSIPSRHRPTIDYDDDNKFWL